MKLERGAFQDEKVIKESDKFICIQLWSGKEEDDKVFDRYGVEQCPTLVFLNGNGDKIKESDNRDAEALAKELADVAKDYKPPEDKK